MKIETKDGFGRYFCENCKKLLMSVPAGTT